MQEIASSKQSSLETWFDNLIGTLRAHELQINTKTADSELESFYDTMRTGNADSMAKLTRGMSQQHFLKSIVIDYIQSIKDSLPLKLAFDFHDSEVSVWAEVKDDDREMERTLLKAEALINSKYYQYGFDMETTIVEKGDGLKIPNHYKPFKS